MQLVVLDGNTLADKKAVHAFLAQKLKFPEWYGANLDALFDCLTDLPPTVLFVQNPHANPANVRILKVLYAAAAANPRLWLYVQ